LTDNDRALIPGVAVLLENQSVHAVPLDGDQSSPTAAGITETEMPLWTTPQTFFLGGLFVLAVFAALYVASSVVLPIVLAT